MTRLDIAEPIQASLYVPDRARRLVASREVGPQRLNLLDHCLVLESAAGEVEHQRARANCRRDEARRGGDERQRAERATERRRRARS